MWNNEALQDEEHVVNAFDTFFAMMGQEIASKITWPDGVELCGNMPSNAASLSLSPFKSNTLIEVVNWLNNRDSEGNDEYLIKPLLHLKNLIFSVGIYSSVFKT